MYGLHPRPELPAEEVAVLIAVAEELLAQQSQIDDDEVSKWRFSGRWFNAGPFANRRPY
jgi:hypothetical protein